MIENKDLVFKKKKSFCDLFPTKWLGYREELTRIDLGQGDSSKYYCK